MRKRCFTAALPTIALLSLFVLPAVAQAQAASSALPRTAAGQPDLQGVWDFRTITPLERPASLGERETLTDEESAELELQAANRKIFDGPAREGDGGAYNDFWLDLGTNVVDTKRTSLIVDPPDGRLPALTPTARRQAGSLGADLPGERPVRYRAGGIAADGPEDLPDLVRVWRAPRFRFVARVRA